MRFVQQPKKKKKNRCRGKLRLNLKCKDKKLQKPGKEATTLQEKKNEIHFRIEKANQIAVRKHCTFFGRKNTYIVKIAHGYHCVDLIWFFFIKLQS